MNTATCWRAGWGPARRRRDLRRGRRPRLQGLAFKPRDQWHTFWNAGDGPCRILEIISPAGFEHYFDELAAGVGSPEDYQARYGTQVDLDRTRRLCEQYGLQFPISA